MLCFQVCLKVYYFSELEISHSPIPWYTHKCRILVKSVQASGTGEGQKHSVTCFWLVIRFIGLFHTARDCTIQFTVTHTHTPYCPHSRLLYCCFVVASNSGCSPSAGFPTIPVPQLPGSNSNSSQGPNRSSPLTNSLTPQSTSWTPSLLTCPPCNILARTAQKRLFLCCCAIVGFVSVGVPTWSLLSLCLQNAVFCGAIT
jgi:hypothetical protein